MALASSGPGGGKTAPPEVSVADAKLDICQPSDGQTALLLTLVHPQAHAARVRLEYATPSKSWTDGTSHVSFIAGQSASRANDGSWDVPASTGGTGYRLEFDHSAAIGTLEIQDLELRFRYGRAAAGTPTQLAPVARATVGREAPEARNFTVKPRSGDEDPFVITADYLERSGADLATTVFAIEYSFGPDATGSPLWHQAFQGSTASVPVGMTLSVANPTPIADGRFQYQLSFTLDPCAATLPTPFPRRILPRLDFRITTTEYYPRFDACPPVSKTSTPQVAGLSNVQIGAAPRILKAIVPQPDASNNQAPLHSYLKLPVTLALDNPSCEDVTVQLKAKATVTSSSGSDTYDATLIAGPTPNTALTLSIPAGQQVTHYTLWDVLADEGMGLLLDNPPQNPKATASLDVIAERVDGSSVGTAIQGNRMTNSTTLFTRPFVDFQETLVDPSGSAFVSSGFKNSNRSRNIFYATFGGHAQELVLNVDQQFEPVQIPGIQSIDFKQRFGVTNGISEILPTDFVPGLPDCLARLDNFPNYYYSVVWDAAGVPTATPLTATSQGSVRAPFTPLPFKLGPNGSDAAVFFTHDLPDATGQLTIYFLVLWQSQGQWNSKNQNFVHAIPLDPSGNVAPVKFNLVEVDLDGNPATFDLVAGTLGTEYGTKTPQRPGVMHGYSVTLDQAGQVSIVETKLPDAPPPSKDANRVVSSGEWFLQAWQPGAGQPNGVVLARGLDGTPSLPKEYDAQVLTISAQGNHQWSPLSVLSCAQSPCGIEIQRLGAAEARDLDGDGRSDLMLLLFENDATSSSPKTDPNFLDVWLLARRRNNQLVWRRMLNDQQALPPAGSTKPTRRIETGFLVDVNGDRNLDLVLRQTNWNTGNPRTDQGHTYYASLFSGVAGGFESVPSSPNGQPCRRPGLFDADADGFEDMVTGGQLFLRQPDGGYNLNTGGFRGALDTSHWAEQVLPPWTGRRDFDLMLYDPKDNANNGIDVLAPNGQGGFSVAQKYRLLPTGGRSVLFARPLMTTSSVAAKDIVAVMDPRTSPMLWRARLAGNNFVFDAAPISNETVQVPPALVRQGAIQPGDDWRTNARVQDLVAAHSDGRSLLVLRAVDDYDANRALRYQVGAATEQVLRVVALSADTDAQEDVLVLTRDDSPAQSGKPPIFRVRALLQGSPNPNDGLTSAPGSGPKMGVLLLQFESPFGNRVGLRSFDAERIASGGQAILVLDDLNSTGPAGKSEVRFVKPLVENGNLVATMVRCPIPEGSDEDLILEVDDPDGDGFVEVKGAEATSQLGSLKQLQVGFRR